MGNSGPDNYNLISIYLHPKEAWDPELRASQNTELPSSVIDDTRGTCRQSVKPPASPLMSAVGLGDAEITHRRGKEMKVVLFFGAEGLWFCSEITHATNSKTCRKLEVVAFYTSHTMQNFARLSYICLSGGKFSQSKLSLCSWESGGDRQTRRSHITVNKYEDVIIFKSSIFQVAVRFRFSKPSIRLRHLRNI